MYIIYKEELSVASLEGKIFFFLFFSYILNMVGFRLYLKSYVIFGS